MTASNIKRAELALRDIAMAYPEAHEDFPWGERAIKIKGKVFVFMHASAEQLSLTTKLPASSEMALLLPYVSPTGYGLKQTLGESAGTQTFQSIEQADVIVVIGANPSDAHPVFASRLKRRVREGAQLIVIDPRATCSR